MTTLQSHTSEAESHTFESTLFNSMHETLTETFHSFLVQDRTQKHPCKLQKMVPFYKLGGILPLNILYYGFFLVES